MKLFSLSLIAALAVVAIPAEAATYHNANYFDQKLKITERLEKGTMLPRVRQIQTQMINGKLFTNEPAVDKNMTHLRHLSSCSVKPVSCKAENTTW